MTCFVQMLLALFTTRTVNLNRLACMIQSGATEQTEAENIHVLGIHAEEKRRINQGW